MNQFVLFLITCGVSLTAYSLGPKNPSPPEDKDPLPAETIFHHQLNLSPGIEALSNPWIVPNSRSGQEIKIVSGDSKILLNGKVLRQRNIVLNGGDQIQLRTKNSSELGKVSETKMLLNGAEHFFVVKSDLKSERSRYYRAMFRGDPSQELYIGYGALGSLSRSSQVFYDTQDCGTDLQCYRYSTNSTKELNFKGMNNVFVHLENLEPQTKYFFVVVEDSQVSRRFYVETLSNSSSDRLSIVAGGDSRNNQTVRRQSNLMVAKLNPHFVYFGGDMTGADTSWEWRQWMDDWQLTIRPDGKIIPIITARGNHERSDSVIENLFHTEEDVYYSLSIHGSLLKAIVLNTERSISGSQTTWLKQELENSREQWKLAIYHKPMRPHTSGKSEGNRQYGSWAQLFYDHSVQLVVESDSHTVKRTYPVRPSSGQGSDEGFVEASDGTVYVGEGCWGAPLRTNNDDKEWTRASGSFNQFKWLWIDTQKIELRTVKTHNASSVNALGNSNRFSIPSNLDVWNPASGQVVSIEARNYSSKKKKESLARN